MKTYHLTAILLILLIAGCQTKSREKVPKSSSPENLGLRFINDYIQSIGKMEMVEWIEQNPSTTQNFKSSLRSLVENAEKETPGYGLGFDPILDAQDYPDRGFDLKSIDTNTGYVAVVGKDWKDFELTIKLIYFEGKWLVDGSGIVNIPQEKQAPRD